MGADDKKIRVLLTKSRLDGHDRGIRYVARRLREAGMEVIFTRYRDSDDIINSALQEDVDVIGISFSVGGYLVISSDVMKLVKEKGMDNTLVIVGGIIPEDDVPELLEMGISKTFGPGSYADDIIEHISTHVS
jgi:methylmalonyl-CoA mutase C-terminal domain/subunit